MLPLLSPFIREKISGQPGTGCSNTFSVHFKGQKISSGGVVWEWKHATALHPLELDELANFQAQVKRKALLVTMRDVCLSSLTSVT